jgi:hypothetical protein
LKLSTPEFLGIFDETPSSVSISALSRFDFDLGQGNSMMGVTAASLSWIKIQNRVLAIYCTVPYQRKGDIDSTRKNILLWRDSILAANIEGLPTGSSKRAMSQLTTESKTGTRAASHLQNEDKMDWRKIIDKAIVGAFFGLCWVVMHGMKSLIKRRKKDQM